MIQEIIVLVIFISTVLFAFFSIIKYMLPGKNQKLNSCHTAGCSCPGLPVDTQKKLFNK